MPRPERRLDGGDGPLPQFAAGLRVLREQAGGPGYRELAGRAHFSAAALSAAAGGKKLPSLAVTLAYVQACGGDRQQWEQRWRAVAAQLGAVEQTGSPEADQVVPYRGLACFQPQDAPWFYGRDDVVRHLVDRLASRRLLIMVGSSGVGKSSVLRAGLLPAVAAGALSGGQPWPVVVMTPGAGPLQELAVRLATLVGVPAGTLLDDWAIDPARVDLTVRQVLAGQPPEVGLLLVVDQFEEVFTLCDAPTRAGLVAALVAATRAPDSRLRVVLGVRADFYDQCLQEPQLAAELAEGQVPVTAMSAAQVREAIVGPAERAGLMVEGALVAAIVAEGTGRAGVLPLVSHVLLQVWQRRRGAALTVTAYEAAGGVGGAIAQTAEQIWAEMDDTGRRVTRDTMLRMVQVGEQGDATRRRVHRSELAGADTDAVLQRWGAARLLTLDRDTVEIAHEALIDAWPRLRDWVDTDRDGIRLHRQLTAAAVAWESLDRDPGALYRGVPLSAAIQWHDTRTPTLSELERQFLTASLTTEQAATAVRQRRRRRTMAGLSVAVTVITVLAGLAWIQAVQAREQRDLAVARRLVAEARAQLAVDPELAVLLAEEAYRRHADPDSETVLRQAVNESRLEATYTDHQADVTSVAFSPDGQRIASADTSGEIHIRDLTGAVRTVLSSGSTDSLYDVAFSPDGHRIAAVGSSSGDVTSWDLARPHDAPSVLGYANNFFGDDNSIYSAIRRVRDGDIGGADIALKTWDDSLVLADAVSPDGARVAIAKMGGTVQVWGTTGNRPPTVLRGLDVDGPVIAIAFSPDGTQIATGTTNGIVRIWNADSTDAPAILTGDNGGVMSLAFSPDGTWIAIGTDHTIQIREVAHPEDALVLRGHQDVVTSLAFSPDGHRLASGSADHTVRIWDVTGRADPTIVTGHGQPTAPTVVNHGGNYTVSIGQDHVTIQLSNTTTRQAPAIVYYCDWSGVVQATQVSISADGTRTVAFCADGQIRTWDTPSDAPTPHNAGSGLIVSSPNAPVLAASITRPSLGEAWKPNELAVSADAQVAAVRTDGAILVWPTNSSSPTVMPGNATTVAFSPDGQYLASIGRDHGIQLRRTHGDTPPITIAPYGSTPIRLTFSADGRSLITTHTDHTTRQWSCDACGPITEVLRLARQRTTRQLTPTERRTF